MARRFFAVLAFVIFGVPDAAAQDPYNLTAPVRGLATLFTDLYGPNGLIVDSLATLPGEQSHSAHFNSDFQSDFSQFGTALVSQLVSSPLPSPASGFTYHFNASLGTFERTTQSFGPIMAERADTIGSGRLSFGTAFQRFSFDTVEGLDLSKVPAVFAHDSAELRGGREDVVTTMNSIAVTMSQFTTFLTLGITDRVDISLAVPVVSNDVKVVSVATVQRLGTTNELTHFFRQNNGDTGATRIFSAAGAASGIGDLTVRLKGTVWRGAVAGVAAGMDVRLPTGSEMDLLGTGAAGLEPFGIWSATYGKVSPHVNGSYKWNGSSVLAGNPATGESADFPDQFTYAAGADLSVNSRLTVAMDVLGRYVIDSERLVQQPFHALDGKSVFPNIVFAHDSFSTLGGALGFKVNVVERLLIDVNVLFKLDEHGLRDKVTPLIGVEYAF